MSSMLMWWVQVALAGQVYVNGTLVDPAQIAGTRLEKVTITFDAAGNVQVSAPGYKIEVMGPPATAAAPAPTPQPYAAPPAIPPVAAAVTSGYGAQPGARVHPSGVPKATWWLATEDNGSVGHVVEVLVNGQLAQTITSGEPIRLMDIGAHLRPGDNKIVIRSISQGASGGTMYVYLGTGSDQSGTVVMDAPQVQYGLGPSRSGAAEREYAVTVR